jgi:hypothetical protein
VRTESSAPHYYLGDSVDGEDARMTRPEPPDLGSLSAERAQWVSQVCNEFEDRWNQSRRPTVREYLDAPGNDAAPDVRLVLLHELLTSERELRDRESRAHGVDAYRAVFNGPGETDVIDFVLGDQANGTGAQRFRVLKPHAGGGLGDVFIAHDCHVDREVALKKIKPSLADDEVCRNRFIREAEITGQLEHPNIAPVYAFGLDQDELPFYAMRFIDGEPLDDAIKRLAPART